MGPDFTGTPCPECGEPLKHYTGNTKYPTQNAYYCMFTDCAEVFSEAYLILMSKTEPLYNNQSEHET